MNLRAAAQAPSPGARQGDIYRRVSRSGEGGRSGRAAAHFTRTMSRLVAGSVTATYSPERLHVIATRGARFDSGMVHTTQKKTEPKEIRQQWIVAGDASVHSSAFCQTSFCVALTSRERVPGVSRESAGQA